MNRKAIFLDRDGVINQERGEYTFLLKDFIINDDVFETLKIWNDAGYLLIIISNQGGIGKGIYSHSDVQVLNEFLCLKFKENKIDWTEMYYCPHHPEYNGRCLCRKPGSILFEKAIAKYSIDVTRSFMIGDKERDILASEKTGIKGILIEANSSLKKILSLIP